MKAQSKNKSKSRSKSRSKSKSMSRLRNDGSQTLRILMHMPRYRCRSSAALQLQHAAKAHRERPKRKCHGETCLKAHITALGIFCEAFKHYSLQTRSLHVPKRS